MLCSSVPCFLLSSHDLANSPRFPPLSPPLPTEKLPTTLSLISLCINSETQISYTLNPKNKLTGIPDIDGDELSFVDNALIGANFKGPDVGTLPQVGVQSYVTFGQSATCGDDALPEPAGAEPMGLDEHVVAARLKEQTEHEERTDKQLAEETNTPIGFGRGA
jgi:hypothetical protein